MKKTAALTLFFFVSVQARAQQGGCDIQTDEFSTRNPIVLKLIDGTQNYEFDDPDDGNSVLFESGQKVWFACPGSRFKNTKNVMMNAKCVEKNLFTTDNVSGGEKQSFGDLTCNNLPSSALKDDGKCGRNNSAYNVGFNIEEIFVKMIDICFNDSTKSAVYVKHKVSPSIAGSQKNSQRTPFKEDKLFKDVSANMAYKKSYQEELFAKYVDADTVKGYVNERQYLARGHLAPMADFVFAAQQRATFYYANTAPQWQSFNSGNWGKLEAAIRTLAIGKNAVLTIFTGTYGVFRIGGQAIYLAVDSSGRSSIPVPLVFWKVVHDEKSGQAVAFVGINDPKADPGKNRAKSMCSGRCSEIHWVTFKMETKSGLMYCCTVDELRRTVKTIPPIGQVSLLTD